ncbi:MAG TPA: YaiO family outer membrane beta-barrel protein [Allosphingosinicella sp.]
MRRRALAFALALVSAAPSPASAQAPTYEEGVAARHAGDTARAITILRQAVAAEPENADAYLQLGLALLAAGKLDDAEAAFRRTLAIAPAYEDARIGLARVAQRRGDRAAALQALEPVSPTNTDAAGLRTQLAAGTSTEYRWQLNLDGSYSALEGNAQPDWKEGSVQLRYQATEDTDLAGTLEASRRFGATDVYGELRIDHSISGGAAFYLGAGGTPNADFRPEWQIGAGGSAKLRGGTSPTSLTLDARQARYRSGDIQTVVPGVEQYLAGGRAWVTARWINIFDETGAHRSGWLVRGDAMAGDRLRLFAGLSDAPDVSEGVVVDTFSLFGGISYDLDERSTLRLSVAHEDRAQGSDRLQLGLGIGRRF